MDLPEDAKREVTAKVFQMKNYLERIVIRIDRLRTITVMANRRNGKTRVFVRAPEDMEVDKEIFEKGEWS